MFRKITAILLTIAMLFSISLCACAEENGQPPEPPSGDMAPPDGGNGQPPEKPDGNPPEGGPGGGGFGGGTPPGGGTSDFTYTAVTEITEDIIDNMTHTRNNADFVNIMKKRVYY